MTKRNSALLAILMPLLLVGPALFAQSLGDFARQQRELRAKEGKQPVKVYTNDNLPARPPGEGLTAASGISTTPSSATSPSAANASGQVGNPSTTAAKPVQAGTSTEDDKKKTKEYWQGKFKAARAVLARAEEEQRLAEDELNLLQIQQVREVSPTVQSEIAPKIAAKQAEVETMRATTEKARKALEDLQQEFKESGAPEEWSKAD